MILHVDMNAYFATLEQQWNPALRGKPIFVCGKGSGERTVIATASYEAKRLGVKAGMAIWEGRKLCPNATLVAAQYPKYVETTKKIVAILETFTPDVEIFSIDEAFLKITNPHSNISSNNRELETIRENIRVALMIKRQIREKIGELCTCSIGIAPNKLLAKIAGEFQKPDGLTVIPSSHLEGGTMTVQELLQKIELGAIPGIGPRVLARLNRLGISTVKDLQNTRYEILASEFGDSYTKFLYNASRGIDDSPLVRFRDAPEEKSFGHSYTLPKEVYTLQQAKQVLLHLAEKVGVRMRKRGFYGRTVHVWLRFTDMAGWGEQTTLPAPTDDGYTIYKTGERLINSYLEPLGLIRGSRPIRAVGISCGNLSKSQQLTLFTCDRKLTCIPKLLDQINQKHGDWTLIRADALAALDVVEYIPDGRNRREFIA